MKNTPAIKPTLDVEISELGIQKYKIIKGTLIWVFENNDDKVEIERNCCYYWELPYTSKNMVKMLNFKTRLDAGKLIKNFQLKEDCFGDLFVDYDGITDNPFDEKYHIYPRTNWADLARANLNF